MSFSSWRNKARTSNAPATQGEVVSAALFDSAKQLPMVYKPKMAGLDLSRWYQANKDKVDSALAQYGAVLLRGFNVHTQGAFSDFAKLAIEGRAAYIEGATPRTNLGDGIYTSTEFAADHEIDPHNELSYVLTPPSILGFCCITAAKTGGQTPVTNVAAVYESLDKAIIDEFERRGGWMLKRNYMPGFGPNIFKAFGLDDIDQIKAYCDKADLKLEQAGPDHWVTTQVRPAVHYHPVSKKPLWFNHIAFWHPHSLPSAVRGPLAAKFAEPEFPFYTCYGDGTPIAEATIEAINQAYDEQEVVFDWHPSDVLLLDNFLVAHGRKPFAGERKVLVTMG